MADPAVCVLGAGPAGCVIAYRLATLGHDVALVARSHARRRPMGETVPTSVERLLEAVGLGEFVPMAAYRVATDGLVLWESKAPVAHPSPTLLLRRDRFDALLCMAAERAGVRVLRTAAGVTLLRRPDGGWRASFTTATGDDCIEATFLVDARGRRGGGTRRLAPRPSRWPRVGRTPRRCRRRPALRPRATPGLGAASRRMDGRRRPASSIRNASRGSTPPVGWRSTRSCSIERDCCARCSLDEPARRRLCSMRRPGLARTSPGRA